MRVFELEIWPDKKKMRLLFIWLMFVTVLAWVAFAIGKMYWTEYTYPVRNLRGTVGTGGWPVPLVNWGLGIGIGMPVLSLIVFFARDRKRPLLALNSEGLFINAQMIKNTFVKWSDIRAIENEGKNGQVSMAVYFKNSNDIIARQSSSKRPFLSSTLKDGQPLVCDTRFAKGDMHEFIEKAKFYTASR